MRMQVISNAYRARMKWKSIARMSAMALALGTAAGPVCAIGACDSFICMAGMVQGAGGGPDCVPAARAFFSITVYDELGYDAPATAAARAAYLSSCPGAIAETNGPILSAIIGIYGTVPGE